MREYSDGFFDYIERGSIASARRFAAVLCPLLKPNSILDVGCGRGAWLKEWRAAGVKTVHGVDGPYVQRDRLLVMPDEFTPEDLSKPFKLDRRFDLVTSLEVAEHLPPSSSSTFVASLTSHSDVVLFSAATVGQGGEHHINERPLNFWQNLFAERGYVAFDLIRPRLRNDLTVEPWYRYNSVLYVKSEALLTLPGLVTLEAVAPGKLKEIGDARWIIRRSILRFLPTKTVTSLAQWNARRNVKAFERSSQ